MIHISIAFCSSPGALGFRPDTRRSAPGWPSRGRFRLCKDLFETRDLGFRHASDSAEFHGANLIHLDRITQRFVGDADLLGGGGHAVAGTVAPPLLHNRLRFAHEKPPEVESGTLGTSAYFPIMIRQYMASRRILRSLKIICYGEGIQRQGRETLDA